MSESAEHIEQADRLSEFHDRETVKLVLDLGASFAAERRLDTLLEKIVDHSQLVTNADGCTLYLREPDGRLGFCINKNHSLNISLVGTSENLTLFPPIPMDPTFVSAYASIHNKTINIPDVYSCKDFDFTGPKRFDEKNGYTTRSMLVSPLSTREGEVVGVLQIINAQDRRTGKPIAFDAHYEFLINSLSNYAAIAIHNLRLTEKARQSTVLLKEANRDAIFSLAMAAEAKDDDTGDHIRRIQSYIAALALRVGLSREDVELISLSSIMHDVGKISVPDDILKKPGKLSDEELEVMRLHTKHGMNILPNKAFFEMARAIAKHHHERWDGTGYPDKLAGENIPFAARMVAIADVFDALTSNRPYKQAWPFDVAIEVMKKGAGTQFDPKLILKWVELYEDGTLLKIRNEWNG
ncbi:MAG: HD domain-containing protein [Nitrospinae bacterium]|nr:HD domain-containing protein [Nitrospinota bacterium]